jgi:acyl carrier protein
MSEFLREIETAGLENQGTVSLDTQLSVIPGWDSLALVTFMAAIDEKLSVVLDPAKIAVCLTARDLAALLGGALTEG